MPRIDLKGALGKKIGPLPAWGWAVAIGGGLLVWRMTKGGSGSGGSGTPFAFDPAIGSGGGGSGGGGGSILPDLFEPTPTPNASVNPLPGTNTGVSVPALPIAFPSFPSISLPSFGGINDLAPIASPAIQPVYSGGASSIQSSQATSPAVGSGTAGAIQARAATAQVQAAAAKVATPTATAISQLATQSGLDAAEAIFLVQRQATSAVRTAAAPVAKTPAPTIKPKPVPTTAAPKKTATIRKAPTAVTRTVYELAGPNLRGGTRL